MKIAYSRFCLFCSLFLSFNLWGQELDLTTNGSARATAYGMQNKIVTISRNGRSYSYITYMENTSDLSSVGSKVFKIFVNEIENTASGSILINKVEVGETWEKFLDKGEFPEPHGTASLTVDAGGFLHVVFFPHYDFIKYRKSTSSLYLNPLSFQNSQDIPTLKSTNSGTIDRWTYPLIKTDGGNVIHVAGSLDSRYTLDGDGNDEHFARELGYVRNLNYPNSNWTFPLPSIDPLRQYLAPWYLSRYDPMMNIDGDEVIHVLAPDQYPYLPNEGYLDYYYFKSEDGGDSFERFGMIYSNDSSLNEAGIGNIAFDANNHPHFLVSVSDFNSPRSRWLRHVYFNGTGWSVDNIFLDNLNIHLAKVRIDKDNNIYIVAHASAYQHETGDPSTIIVLYKSTQGQYLPTVVKAGGLLYWTPSIEEEEKFTVHKNWFYILWQEAGKPDDPQTVKLLRIIPYNTTIQSKTFSKYGEFYTGNFLEVGQQVQVEASARLFFRAKDSVVLKPGISINKGAFLNISVDDQICNNNKCLDNPNDNNSGGRINNSVQVYHVTSSTTREENHPISISPNPSAGKFLIKNKKGSSVNIEVYNSLGQKIFSRDSQKSEHEIEIDLSGQSNGVFILKIFGDSDVTKVFRLVKK